MQWTPSNPITLGTSQFVLIKRVALFQGTVIFLWVTLKWHNAYRGNVQIRGSPLYWGLKNVRSKHEL